LIGAFALASCVLLIAGIAQAHPEPVSDGGSEHHGTDTPGDVQHGPSEGHLADDTSENVDLVGKLRLTTIEGAIADVAVKGDYAYLNQWSEACPNGGVHVVDISDPAAPNKIGFLPANKNSYPGEGAQVINVTTKWFSGDVFLHNNEACNSDKPFKGGISLWNVTNPTAPEALARGVGDWDRVDPRVEHPSSNASQSHSVFAWDAGARAYAVFVDNEELADVDIMDISKPTAPVHIGEFDLNALFPQIVDHLGTAESFHHDVVVKHINGTWYMLVSYWDGGYVVLNVNDPTNPTYVADSDFPVEDSEAAASGFPGRTPEGNAHEAEFSKNNDYIVAADEDFNPYKVIPRNVTDDTEFTAIPGSDTPAIDEDSPMSGDTVWVGQACPGDPAVPAAPDTDTGSQIALVERGVCDFTVKQAAVEAAGGYEGVIVFNRELADGCEGLIFMDIQGTIPSVFVTRSTGWDLLNIPGYDEAACQAATQPTPSIPLGTVGDEVDMSAVFDGWGYVRLFRNDLDPTGANKLTELDTFAVDEAHDPDYAEGYGDLSVHEVAMSHEVNELAYFSYYSAGFRVMQIEDDQLVEVGHFADAGGNNFWGVQVWEKDGKEYVLASDRDYGLYIFEYTGDGGPNA
jgi:hypothetical protein